MQIPQIRIQPIGSRKPVLLKSRLMILEFEDSAASSERRLHAKIHGRVQGVGFRAFVLNYATALRLTGTVRNVYIPGQYVEVNAEGPESVLQEFLVYLREGPQLSRVESVDIIWSQPLGNDSSFRII